MSLIINNNLSALNTHRNLSRSGSSMSKAIEKLSSGYQINVGADDPSGLIISEQLRSQISGLERAVRNSSEASNLIGIAEGALNEMNSILKKMRALAIHAANSGVTSPEQVAADQAEMDSGIATLDRIANTTRYSDQYLLNGSKELVYDINTVVNGPNDHQLLDTKQTRVDQIFKRDGVKMTVGFAGEKNRYQANTDTSAKRAYLEADNADGLCQIDDRGNVTEKQEFILTGSQGSRMFTFKKGEHLGAIVSSINNVRDSTGIGAALTFASDIRIDKTTGGTYKGSTPDYDNNLPSEGRGGYDDGSYVYQSGDVQIYGAGLNDPATSKIKNVNITPDAAASFKVGFNCDGDGKIYAKIVDKSTNSIEYYKDKECTMLIGKGDDKFFAAVNNSGIPSSPTQNLDGIFIELNDKNCEDLDVFEIGFIGQRLDNQKDMNVSGLQGWTMVDNSVISGVNLGVNTSEKGQIYFRYSPVEFAEDGKTVKTFKVEAFTDSSYQKQYLVATSEVIPNNMNVFEEEEKDEDWIIGGDDKKQEQLAGQTVRLESVQMANGQDSGLSITLTIPKPGVLEGMTGMTLDDLRASSPEMEQWFTEYDKIKGEYETAVAAYKKYKEETYDVTVKDEEAKKKAYDKAVAEYEKQLAKKNEAQDTRDAANDDHLTAKNEFEAQLLTSLKNMIETSGMMDKALTELNAMVGGYPNEFGDKFLEEIAAQTKRTLSGSAFNSTLDTTIEDYAKRVRNNIEGAIKNNPVGYYRHFENNVGGPRDKDTADAVLTNILNQVEQNIEDTLHADMPAQLALFDEDTSVDEAFDTVKAGLTTDIGHLDALAAPGTTPSKTDELLDVIKTVAADFLSNNTLLKPPPNSETPAQYAARFAAAMNDVGTSQWYIDNITVPGSPAAVAVTNILNAVVAEVDGDVENHVVKSFAAVAKDYRQTEAKTMDKFVTDKGALAPDKARLEELDEVIDPSTVRSGYGYNFVKDFSAEISKWIDANIDSYSNMETFRSELTGYLQSTANDMLAVGKYSYIFGQQPPPADAQALKNIGTITTGILDAVDTKLAGMTKAEIQRMSETDIRRIANAALSDGIYLKDDFEYLNTKNASGTAILDQMKAAADGYLGTAYDPLTDDVKTYMDGLETAIRGAVTGAQPFTGMLASDKAVATGVMDQLIGVLTNDYFTEVKNNIEKGVQDSAGGFHKFDAVINQHRQSNSSASGEEWYDLVDVGGLTPDNVDALQTIINDTVANFLSNIPSTADSTALAAYLASFETDLTQALEGSHTYNANPAMTAVNTLMAAIAAEITPLVENIFEDGVEAYRTNAEVGDLFDLQISQDTNPAHSAMDQLNKVPDPVTGVLNNYGDQLLEEIDAKVKDYLENTANYTDFTYSNFRDKFVDDITKLLTDPLTGDVWAKLGADQDLKDAAETIIEESLKKMTKPKEGETNYLRDYAEKRVAYDKAEAKLQTAITAMEDAEKEMDAADAALEVAKDATALAQDRLDELKDAVTELNDDWAAYKKQHDLYAAGADGANSVTPKGEQVGSITFTNLGMRIYSTDYGSAETIRIQNKTGQLFYQYLDADSLDKKMVAADTTVQVAGDDAQISLNGAPIFTTGLTANTTTPDFSGSLVFNQGTLGKTSLAITGYDQGKYFSKATDLQGVEENEPDIQAYERSFEPPALTVPMGSGDPALGTQTGLRNAQNQPIDLYVDFTQLDPTVQVKITNLGKPTDVKITYDYDSVSGVGKIRIDASRMMPLWGDDDTEDTNEYLKMNNDLFAKWKNDNPTVTNEETIQAARDDIYQQVLNERGELIIEEEVNISNLSDGYYVTNPNLKGLYITSSDLIDMAKSQSDEGPLTMQTTPNNGELLLKVNTYATNPRSTTSESMSDFVGGMQFQLGATEGNQDRTIYSIQSMSMSNLGRITWEGTDYCLQDVLGGGIASLTKDPILAMRVLQQAVDDVSGLRSRLGAFQSNMLQTNINSLEVAIENITKTESAIRDTDMAAESTQFTRFQIMQQAGTSMLAQANQISQNVLSLLQ